MEEKKGIFSKLDIMLLICVALSCAAGLFVINSAAASYSNHSRFVSVQLLAIGLGAVVMTALTLINYNFLYKLRYPILLAALAMLGAVLVMGFGYEESGTRGWIDLGFVNIQPSELAKVCFIITLAAHISKVQEDINAPRNVLMLLIHMLLYIVPIILQPDFGTALVFVIIFFVMLFLAHISYKYIAAAIGAITLLGAFSWLFVLKEYQRNRIISFLNPENDPLGSGYHVIQSKIAIGSGQLFGKGYMQGSQTQLGYLPEKQTDFIFGVIGEELGLIGACITTALLLTIIFRCFQVANSAKDSFGEMLASGVGALLLFHTIENIGMCLGLLPVTGIPLPFFSYGGSSILSCLAAIGIVESVKLHSQKSSF
ncbi:MAG: rod shape-determining protein RodA [Clostridia bacterium]|nr:rod shape-determining protein RodA [Clostridia bacterium]